MKKYLKENWKFLLLVLIGGLIGGYCAGLYSYDSLSEALLKQLQDQNITKEMVALSSAIQYGISFGVILASIEEIMMRLFLMSLVVFIVSKMFFRNKKEIPTLVFVIANILSALLFAAGHLPSTATMTTLTPVIIIRCFLFNGGLGIAFGYLYRKYNIRYAIISHGLCHLIADILMLIFI